MKTKTVTKAIVKQDGRILLLRRHGGRPSIDGKYELPGGRIHYKQQPEDALRHAFRIHLGVSFETAQLHDALSFIDPEDRDLQYVFVVYNASLNPVDKTIDLSSEYDRYVWKKPEEIQRDELTHSTQQILGLQPIPFSTGEEPAIDNVVLDKIATIRLVAYTDGGSRGNPGPSAAGYVLMSTDNVIIAEGGAFLGITTNNVAEYQAVYLALEKAQQLAARQVDFRLDSQLVVNQMNGIYKVKHSELLPIHNRIRELASHFDKVTFVHVRREYNRLADGVVNKVLDSSQ